MTLSRLHRWLLLLTSASMLLAAGACSEKISTSALEENSPSVESGAMQTDLAQNWGIEIVGIWMSARGHMVDFRYRVVDPVKAAPLFDRNVKPYLVDQETGKVLGVPRTAKVGPLQSTSNEPQEGRIYWMFFGNPGVVESGSKVTVVIGDLEVKNLIVK